jgi:hypothetical protein
MIAKGGGYTPAAVPGGELTAGRGPKEGFTGPTSIVTLRFAEERDPVRV